MLLCAVLVSLRPRVIVEWGTNIGTSARVFYECARHYRIPCEIHSIDLPLNVARRENPGRLRGLLVRGRGVTLHDGDGVETCLKILRSRPNDRSLVFIDGDHARETVLKEARLLWSEFPRLPILFHDTYPNAALEGGGPAAALEELLGSASARTRVVSTQIGPPGLTLVQPPEDGMLRG